MNVLARQIEDAIAVIICDFCGTYVRAENPICPYCGVKAKPAPIPFSTEPARLWFIPMDKQGE